MQITLWLFNIAMENSPFIDGLPIKKCDFPVHFVCLPEGKPPFSYGFPMVFLFPKSKPTQPADNQPVKNSPGQLVGPQLA